MNAQANQNYAEARWWSACAKRERYIADWEKQQEVQRQAQPQAQPQHADTELKSEQQDRASSASLDIDYDLVVRRDTANDVKAGPSTSEKGTTRRNVC